MLSLAFRAARLAATVLLFSCLPRPASAGLILSFDAVALYGAPGDLITITGILTNDGALTEELTSLNPVGLVSPVVILGPGGVLAPSVLGYPDSYSGPIVQLQILPSATPGLYLGNLFNLSYESLNGRTINSNQVEFSVDVQAASAVPEPLTGLTACIGLVLVFALRRLTSRGSRRCTPARSSAYS